MKTITKHIFLIVLFAVSVLHAGAQNSIQAVIPGDFADPSVIRKGSQYYAIGTSSEWAPHFPIYTSKNLKDWKQTGFVFDVKPEWTSSSFWAPEYYYHKGTYYVYYTARRKSDNVSCIGVATSKFPDRGFKDHGIIVAHGKEAIDAFIFNDNGQLYMTYKAYGLDGRPIEILGSKLSDDGLKLEGETFTMMKDNNGIGLEGQSILKKDDYYYLFYSVGNCCGAKCDYNVRIARSKSFMGPYENDPANPALQENADWKCSGHGTFVNSTDGKYYYLYHAYNKHTNVYTGRQGMLAELQWQGQNQWPVFKTLSADRPNAELHISDRFAGSSPAKHWQWDFRNSTPVVKQHKKQLHLSGIIKSDNPSGIVYTVRPAQLGYEISTTVTNQNASQKGLAVYGDANASIGVSIAGTEIQFWMVKDNKRKVISKAMAGQPSAHIRQNAAVPVSLKLTVSDQLDCKAYWKQGSGEWQALPTSNAVSVSFLPPWDRSPRAGLHFNGAASDEAVFSQFDLKYL
ncbi:glycoside hydrolase family 43 protein [Pedobacter deserti]|uniref:glycoside hydrolase family 43 protein n=1 Tax=Pedobacter deserti TaxID=2817382 RepID=UPI002108ADD4|nr:glycoside hydrolase family 43 protein [Pedobacter sp. SYSU D00382]